MVKLYIRMFPQNVKSTETDTCKGPRRRSTGRESKDPGVIRCVIHPLRLHESLSRDKQQRSRRLEFGRVVCVIA